MSYNNFTGYNVFSSSGVTITADNGAFATAFQPASLTYTAINNYTIDAQAGVFTTIGQSIDLLFNRRLAPTVGVYLTSFQDATLVYGTVGQYTLVANNGSFTTTGQNINLSKGRSIQILSGNYITTGQDISFLYNRVIINQSGSFVTTGYSVSLLYSGQENQNIGTVTAAFKQDIYTSIYKPNLITVSFKD